MESLKESGGDSRVIDDRSSYGVICFESKFFDVWFVIMIIFNETFIYCLVFGAVFLNVYCKGEAETLI